MRKSIERWIISLLFCVLAVAADAQINGVVIDNVTGDTIKAPTVAYKGRRIAVVGDSLGHFSIERHNAYCQCCGIQIETGPDKIQHACQYGGSLGVGYTANRRGGGKIKKEI